MAKRDALYELLMDYANLQIEVERVLVGLDWTLCQAGSTGIAQTVSRGQWQRDPHTPLTGRSLAELSLWLRKWDRQQAGIGLAAVNAAINSEADMVYQEGALFHGREALDNALGWFLPRMSGQRVTVIAADNPFAQLPQQMDLSHLPTSQGALHPATEVVLGKSEWLFVHAQTVADKTLPRILELAKEAHIVLYGPQTPWLEEWSRFGIDYLVGSQVNDADSLYNTIAEAGDINALPIALSYRVCDLQAQAALHDAALPAAIRH